MSILEKMRAKAKEKNMKTDVSAHGKAVLGKVISEWVDVTPEMAARWLKKNRQNRTQNKSKIARFGQWMKDNSWLITHQGIAFDVNDVLIDGQHRLEAIVSSGVSFWFLVTTGLPPLARGGTDLGDPRSAKDLLEILGVHGVGKDHAASVAKVMNIIRTCIDHDSGKQNWEQIKSTVLKYKAGLRWMVEYLQTPSKSAVRRLRSAAPIGAFVFAMPADPQAVGEMFREFESGLFKTRDTLAVARDKILGTAKVGIADRREAFYKALSAIHHRLEGKNPSRLYGSDEAVEYFKKLYK